MRPSLRSPHFFFGVTLVLYFGFGLHHIGSFVTADEHYWVYERVPQYFEAWEEWKLRKTFINDKPGVSLALVTGPALLWNAAPDKHCRELDNRLIDCDNQRTAFLFGSFRILILLANGALLFLMFRLLTKLTNTWIALFATILMALSPILLGMTQIVNPDALLWSFSAVALFSWLALMKTGERRYAFLALTALALALLTKYVALILIPGFVLASASHFLLRRDGKTQSALVLALRRETLWFVVITGGAIMLTLLFVPALVLERKYLAEFLMTVPDKERLVFWFAPLAFWFFADLYLLQSRTLLFLRSLVQRLFPWLRLLSLFFLSLFAGLILARHFYPAWSILTLIPFDLKDLSDARYYTSIPTFFEALLLNWNPLVFTLTPLTLFGLALAWYAGARRPHHDFFFFPVFIGLFSLLFTTILIRSNVLATPRYLILLYPLLACAAAIGFWHTVRHCKKFSEGLRGRAERFPIGPHRVASSIIQPTNLRLSLGINQHPQGGRSRNIDDQPLNPGGDFLKSTLAVLLLAGSVVSLMLIRPFYFNYTNALFPKEALLADAWGYGRYEAAQYLNNLPDAESLTVWADYYGVCEFARFKCLTAYTFDQEEIKPDYFVLTRRGQQRYMSRYKRWERLSGLTAYQYYARTDPIWSLVIDGRPGNYVKIYKVER